MVAPRGVSTYSLVSVILLERRFQHMRAGAVEPPALESVQWRHILRAPDPGFLMQSVSPKACSAYVLCHLEDIADTK